MDIGIIKFRAREKMKEDKAVILGVSLSSIVVAFCIAEINLYLGMGFTLLACMVEAFIGVAMTAFFLKIVKTGRGKLDSLKVSPKTYFRYVGYTIFVGLFSFVVSLILCIPIIFKLLDYIRNIDLLLYYGIGIGDLGGLVGEIIILLIIAVAAGIIFNLFFFCTKFLIVEGNSVKESFGKSIEMMKGYKGKLFLTQLSFIGWFLLVIITCGIYSVWFIPYYNASMAQFYLELKRELNGKNEAKEEDLEEKTDSVDEEIIVENTVFSGTNEGETETVGVIESVREPKEEVVEEKIEQDTEK